MKSLLFIALCDISDLTNGVTLKVRAQIEAFKQLGFQVTTATYRQNQISIQNDYVSLVKDSKFRRRDLFIEIRKFSKLNQFDVAFIRFPHFDLSVMSVLRLLKKKGVRVYLEIPSFPVNYPKKSLRVKYFQFFDNIHQHLLKKYIFQVLAVGSPSKTIYGIHNKTIPNGYMHETKPTEMHACQPEQIDILSLSSFYDIHGFDRLIEGYKLYMESNVHSTTVNIHLVGDGPCKSDLVSRVLTLKLEDYIKFYPPMSNDELNDLYKIVNMGCAPLAIHRTNYTYASPLKTKDYFQKGLPYFCAYEEIGIDTNYPYVLKFPLDDTPIDIHQIVSFYQSYQKNCEQVKFDMQAYGEERFNWKNIFTFIK